jgi:glycosyltransferase involved in cell wall biosynthesis
MKYDIICFCHLRWNFVYQRPQHLMSRLAVHHRVFFFEEPLLDADDGEMWLATSQDPSSGVYIVVPHVPRYFDELQRWQAQARLLSELVNKHHIDDYVSWYYSPMALTFSDHLEPEFTVYDCMDELSAFLFAPPALKKYERVLLAKADIVFTGGRSLYQAKRGTHRNIHLFPSSIDKDHFRAARKSLPEPADQCPIPHPRIGFYGVIDERMDLDLVDAIAEARPDWQLILVGPVVKIDPATLPRRPNIHYPGSKKYDQLPAYLSGWDIAMMPFAINESTRFISPTKTPEFLAAGKPVISTSITDVMNPYGDAGLVAIADTASVFVGIAGKILARGLSAGWLKRVDAFLEDQSWDKTVDEMEALIDKGIGGEPSPTLPQKKAYV